MALRTPVRCYWFAQAPLTTRSDRRRILHRVITPSLPTSSFPFWERSYRSFHLAPPFSPFSSRNPSALFPPLLLAPNFLRAPPWLPSSRCFHFFIRDRTSRDLLSSLTFFLLFLFFLFFLRARNSSSSIYPLTTLSLSLFLFLYFISFLRRSVVFLVASTRAQFCYNVSF